MPHQMTNLAKELDGMIVDCLQGRQRGSTLRSLCLVSQAFSRRFVCHLYKRVHLNADSRSLEKLRLFSRTVAQSAELANLVKEIALGSYKSFVRPSVLQSVENPMAAVVDWCSHLTVLHLQSGFGQRPAWNGPSLQALETVNAEHFEMLLTIQNVVPRLNSYKFSDMCDESDLAKWGWTGYDGLRPHPSVTHIQLPLELINSSGTHYQGRQLQRKILCRVFPGVQAFTVVLKYTAHDVLGIRQYSRQLVFTDLNESEFHERAAKNHERRVSALSYLLQGVRTYRGCGLDTVTVKLVLLCADVWSKFALCDKWRSAREKDPTLKLVRSFDVVLADCDIAYLPDCYSFT